MKHRNWFWGIFFLAAGFFVVASQVGGFVQLGFWSIVATVLLLASLIGSLIDVSFFGIFVSAALLYAIYQKPFDWPFVSVWLLLLTAVLISIGLRFIFHGRFRRRWARRKYCGKNWGECSSTEEFIDGSDVSISESFSEASKYLHAECLRQAHISSSFGKLSVYFDGVTISPDGAEIFVDISFGKTEIYLPKQWRVIDQVHTSAGAVTNNTRGIATAPDAPLLTFKGHVSFGNLEIRYV
jgi:predicted membrane protein